MKKVLLILIPILLLGGGGAYFAATKGMINIPGITPKKKVANQLYQEGKEPEPSGEVQNPTEEPETKKPEPPAEPLEDPKLGQAKVAALWNEMDEATLEKLIADWKDDDLAPILAAMSGEKVTKLITRIAQSNPKRASSLTRAIQAEASKIEPPKDEPVD